MIPLKFLVTALSVTMMAGSAVAAANLDEIIVTGRKDAQPLNQLIGEVGRLSSEELTRIGHTHIQEVAVRIPGVWLSRGDGQELLAAVRSPVYTGPGSCGELMIAENGIPIRPAGFCNVNQLFETNSEQAGGLEVWRGAGTVFYGSSAMHGVVNVLAPAIDEQGYLALEAGYHDYKRVKLGWQGQQGDHQWQWLANGSSSDSFKDDAGLDQQKMTLLHNYSGSRWQVQNYLNATNLNQETAGYLAGYEAYEDGRWNDNANPEAYRDARSLRASSRWQTLLGSGASLTLTPYVRYSDMDFIQHYLPGQAIEKNGHTSAGFSGVYSGALSESVSLWLGADLEVADIWVEEFQEAADTGFGDVRYQGLHYDFEVLSRQLAVFTNLEWRLNQVTTLEAGVRWESLRYQYDNRMLAGSSRDDGSACAPACRYFRPDDRTDDFNNLSGHLGVHIDLSDRWSFYGRLANAYRAPQVSERYRLLNGQSVTQFEDKSLQSFELGLRYQSGMLAADVSGYVMRKDDVILKASNNQTVGDGETDHAGLEAAVALTLNPQWQLSAAAAWARHRVDQSSELNGESVAGNRMDTAPEWLASAQLLYRYSPATLLELEWVYMDDYFLDTENTAEYDGHQLLNLRAEKRWANQWSTTLRLKNLLDERYAERADYAFGSYRYFVGEGRGLFVEIRKSL
ncbi:MAG: TonB-dependent receptor [Candidatus Pelagadaptatus aseana]|uniref:TonB-dependent receptor n=1 Tax=Candidatus Pelagadaptatus aseana TaxID=3120508 RepID=UPI0039B29CA7